MNKGEKFAVIMIMIMPVCFIGAAIFAFINPNISGILVLVGIACALIAFPFIPIVLSTTRSTHKEITYLPNHRFKNHNKEGNG